MPFAPVSNTCQSVSESPRSPRFQNAASGRNATTFEVADAGVTTTDTIERPKSAARRCGTAIAGLVIGGAVGAAPFIGGLYPVYNHLGVKCAKQVCVPNDYNGMLPDYCNLGYDICPSVAACISAVSNVLTYTGPDIECIGGAYTAGLCMALGAAFFGFGGAAIGLALANRKKSKAESSVSAA